MFIRTFIYPKHIYFFKGFGKLNKVVTLLQQECDKQSKLILTEFTKQRLLERRVSMVNEIERSASQTTASGIIDPKEIDILLGEVTIMHARYHLYLRFLRRRVTVSSPTSLCLPHALNTNCS